ncbi:MAG TPA: dynamin family protein, partial [Lacipirellulaceae bacterium]|nr:dynamin family protein [Lacipirellulaceae bacterium]
MNITSSHENRCLMEWARHVAQLALERDPQIVETIDSLIGQLSQDRLVLSVIGKVNRGKSTLINVLLGRPDDVAAPIDKLPASSAVSRFRRSDSESATVVRRDGQRQPIAFSQIRQYVTEEGNPKNRKEVAVVEIAGPFGGLDSDLELVDTPGAGSLHEHHDEILHRFLPQSDAVI